MMATMADAHREWHLNSGVPMGTPGCPQDACHPPDDYEGSDQLAEPVAAVRCGNVRAHGKGATVYHRGAEGVRACYQNRPGAALDQVTREGAEIVPSSVWLALGEAAAEPGPEPESPKREGTPERYALWRTIPVFGKRGYGYYALPGADGEPDFYRVERPTEGKWKGYTFLQAQAGDAFHKMPFLQAAPLLDKIAGDPGAAGALYGQEIGRCYQCHRTLTDPDSRALGIGPDCRKRG